MDKDGNFIGYKKYDKSIVYFESYKEFTKIKKITNFNSEEEKHTGRNRLVRLYL